MRGITCDITCASALSVTDVEISDVTADSRRAGKGTLFAALCGKRHNGNKFINDAVERGAVAVLTDERISAAAEVPVISVRDVKTVFSRLCARMYADGAASNIIAVTGTNGKTTTAMATAHIFASAGFETAVIGTVGKGFYGNMTPSYDGMTTPVPEELYREIGKLSCAGAEYIIIEASSHGIAEGRLAGLIDTDCALKSAIFTNLSPEHLDYHADMEDYFRVKSRLFTDFGFVCSVINVDGRYGRRMADAALGHVITVGDNADYGASCIEYGADGVGYLISSSRLRLRVRCPAIGAYMAENTLLAAATALTSGIDPLTVTEAIGTFHGVRGRMEKVDTGSFGVSVYIDFAHTPEALSALLTSARRMHPQGRLILLFGCGGDRDKTKRAAMGAVASEYADYVVVTSDNSRTERAENIISDILKGMAQASSYSVIESRKDAIEYTLKIASKGDVILLAGKGHEDYEDRNGEKTRFNEREIVREVIDKINGS